MEIKFIGTGSGKTSLKRNHSSILISTSDHKLLIDVGDGISKALLEQGVNYNSIDSILFTHYHSDHFSGIAALITQMKLGNRKNRLTVFTHGELIKPFMDFINNCYLFKEKLGFELEVIEIDFDKKIEINDNLFFTTRKNSHVKKLSTIKGYDRIRFHSSSIYLEVEDKIIIYTSDVGSADDLYIFNEIQPHYFITETTHISLDEIYSAYKKIKPGKFFLTHIEDEMENQISEWLDLLTEESKQNFMIAYDSLTIKI